MSIELVISSASRALLAAPKLKVTISRVRTDVSRIRAIQAFARMTGMSLAQAQWFLNQLPQPLATPASEHFQEVVMTADEARVVDTELSPYFELRWQSASSQVLCYGMCVVAPWDVKAGAVITEPPDT